MADTQNGGAIKAVGAPEAASPSPDNLSPKMRARVRSLLRAAGPVGLIGVGAGVAGLALGLIIGAAMPATTVAPTPIQVTVNPEVDSAGAEVIMPDVRGLSEQDARQAIADHGIAADKVFVNRVPYLTADGFVVAQEPVNGTKNPAKITLSLPQAASTPDLKGTAEDEARVKLLAMGAQVAVSRRYEPKAQPGVVLETTPKAGKPLTAVVTLVVAASPRTVALSELASNGSCDSIRSSSVNGAVVGPSVACLAGSQPAETYWLLKRRTGNLGGVLGLDDNSDPGARVRVSILSDGKRVFTTDLAYGSSRAVDVDTSSVLRLVLRLQRLDSGSGRAELVFGDAVLTGSADDLALLDR